MNLYELAFTCYIYNSFTDFNNSYKVLQQEVEYSLDLFHLEHRKTLIAWLNKWGCRQFARDYHEAASDELLSWHKEGHITKISRDKVLWELNEQEIEQVADIYDALACKIASKQARGDKLIPKPVGPTGASKILFALRPKVAVPWDEAIRKGLKYSGDGSSYVNYLKRVKKEIETLAESCAENGVQLFKVPEIIKRSGSTIPQLIGEYFWVTETRKFYPPDHEMLQGWTDWSRNSSMSAKLSINNVVMMKAFVGGFTGRSYQVEINMTDSTAEYKVLESGYTPLTEETIILEVEQMKKLLRVLDKVDILNWDEHYDNIDVLDGTNWSVELMFNSTVFQTGGSNAYPEQWNKFCGVLEKVLGRDFR